MLKGVDYNDKYNKRGYRSRRHILKIGNEKSKQEIVYQIIDYYDNNDFKKSDVYDIAIETGREEELFDYCEIDNDFMKEKDYDDYEI